MSSRIHHTELTRRDQIGIALGWAGLALLVVGLLGLVGNAAVLVTWVKIALGLGIVATGAYLSIRKNAAMAWLSGAKGGANATAFTLILLAILGLLNYVSGRHYKTWDLTKQRLYSLSPQTKEVVKNLKEEVQITGFYSLAGRGASEGYRANDLLRQYKDLSPKVKVEMIDPVANPGKATTKGFTGYGNVIWVECGGRKEQVYTVGEQEVSSAILKVTRPQKKKVYFLFGHGELDIEQYESNGLSDAKAVLEKLNYETSKLILQTVKEVPKDAAVVVIAGPKNGIPANEQAILAKYLENAGKLMLLIDPKTPVPTRLLQPYGIEVGNNVVFDPRLGDGRALVERFEPHNITKDLQIALFPLARSVSPAATPPAGVNVTSLAKTPDLAWADTKVDGPFKRDADDMGGPISLAVVATKEKVTSTPNQTNDTKESTRLVVVGNSSFASNAAFQAMNLSDAAFFLNAVNWLAEEEALVNIPPKTPERNTVTLLPNQARWIALTTILIIPVGVLLFGVGVWWRRR
ncbi:MAG: GldG family protein [Armatimonadetes bacterium]|jgi:ABC-type uncharacterized transport system involved in gliding motility auxiliary subunit|nr:GldG family protein [Armatimonadota bacterium]